MYKGDTFLVPKYIVKFCKILFLSYLINLIGCLNYTIVIKYKANIKKIFIDNYREKNKQKQFPFKKTEFSQDVKFNGFSLAT